jgi:hypothetical protein
MKTNRLIISLTVAGVLAIGAISASAGQSVDTLQGVYGCISPVSKNISYLRPTEHTCPSGWSPISWASEGQVGATGPQGLQGPKGDPGYSYEEALASVDDENSSVQSVFFSIDGCFGPGFEVFTDRNERYCFRTFHNLESLNILSVKTGTSNGVKPDNRALSLAPGECPSTISEIYIASSRTKRALLIDGSSPFKLKVESEYVCAVMYLNGGYQAQAGPYQIVYSGTYLN